MVLVKGLIAMEGATMLCTRDGDWDAKFKTSRSEVLKMVLPTGVFIGRKHKKFIPTTHGLNRTSLNSGETQISLVREACDLAGPITVTVAGAGTAVITNTGRKPLHVGEKYYVTYPTKEDTDAQVEAIKLNGVRMVHPRIHEQEKLWGGFLSTVGHKTYKELLVQRISDDIAEEGNSTLYQMGKMIRTTGQMINNYAGIYYDNVRAGNPNVNINAAVAAMDAGETAELIKTAQEVLQRFTPAVWGVVQQNVHSTSLTIPVGGQFFGTVQFE